MDMQESSHSKPNNGHGGARPGAGRPKRPATLAAALRHAFPVDRLVALAEQALESTSDEVRFRALTSIIDRCHGKVPDRLEAGLPGSMDDDGELDGCSIEQLRSLHEMEVEFETRRRNILENATENVPGNARHGEIFADVTPTRNVTPALQVVDVIEVSRRENEDEPRIESPSVNLTARDL